MSQLESQIAKIELFNPKTAANYVFVLAEKSSGSDAELYMVAELPLLNPNALDQCEQICLAVAGGLKRSYKRPLNENSFETAVAQINEEMGKLAGMGQNYWINKFNCVLGVKNENEFTVATCGKTTAYLLRDGQFSDISTSTPESHPLKTFDSFATGKIKLGDIIILSNTQLLNYVSIDRIRDVLIKQSFLSAAQTIIELLKETAGPNVSFGTIMNMQVPLGQTSAEEVNLENYVIQASTFENIKEKILNFFKSLSGLQSKRQNKTSLPKAQAHTETNKTPRDESELIPLGITLGKSKFSLKEKLSKLTGNGHKILHGAKSGLGDFSGKIKSAGKMVSPGQIKNFSPAKKYLFFATVILAMAAFLSIYAAIYNKNVKQKRLMVANQIKLASNDLSQAQSALLYKDDKQALVAFNKAQSELPKEEDVSKDQLAEYKKVTNHLNSFKEQIERKTKVDPENLGSLAESDFLINLPEFFAVQSGKNIISYEKNSGKIEDGKLKIDSTVFSEVAIKPGISVTYNGESLFVWNYVDSSLGQGFISSVPAKEKFVGLSYYPTNSRAYLVDTSKNQIISFLINKDKLQKPVVALTDGSLSEAQDITIDGNVYVLTQDGILKFAAGKPKDFKMPFLFTPFSGKGRLITQIGWQYLYLLDFSQKRIIIIDKKGNLVKILASDKFDNLKDFAVDESQMTIYVLNGSSLLKINY